MKRTFKGDEIVPHDTKLPHPTQEEVEKREAERLKNVDEKTGKPTGVVSLNTAALILESAVYNAAGRPFLPMAQGSGDS